VKDTAVSRAYYPGRREKAGAVVIEIRPGQTVAGLLMMLPEPGVPRAVQICVLDEGGKPAVATEIRNRPMEQDADFAGLAGGLYTDETGCASTSGYTKSRYAIWATTGGDITSARSSETFVIQPGESPARVVLKLHKP
jgi:hypothetical protein